MASSLEIIALKTSGISFKRIILYPILVTVLLAGIVFYINNELQPRGTKKARLLKRKNQINEDKVPLEKSDVFLRGNGDYIYHFDYINRETNEAKGIEIVILNKEFNEIKSIITAPMAKFVDKKGWILYKANENLIPQRTVKYHEEYVNTILTDEPTLFLTPKYRNDELGLKKLIKVIEILQKTGGESKEFEVELHKRFAYPFSCIVLGIIGLALGSKYVRGASAANLALSIALGYGYYMLQASFEAFSMGGVLTPFVGAWIPNIIYLIIAIVVMRNAEY
jgi:lipopolysaccharide export system permease protein